MSLYSFHAFLGDCDLPMLRSDVADPVHALRMIENALPVVRRAREQLARAARGLLEHVERMIEIAAQVIDLADQMQRARAAAERISVERAGILRRVVLQRSLADRIERIETADRLELLAQIAEHELDQAFGFPALRDRFAARAQRIDAERTGQQHAGERCSREQCPLAVAPLLLALLQRVEADVEHAGDQLEPRVRLAIAIRTRVGRDRLGAFVRQATGIVDREAQRRAEAFFGRAIRQVRRVRLAADDQAEDALGATEPLVREHFLVDPARLRGGRRADHDQVGRLRQRFVDLAPEIGRARQLVAVTKDRNEAARDRASCGGLPDQAAWHPVGLDRPMQPLRPGLILVAVADERAIPEACGSSSHRRPPPGTELNRLTRKRDVHHIITGVTTSYPEFRVGNYIRVARAPGGALARGGWAEPADPGAPGPACQACRPPWAGLRCGLPPHPAFMSAEFIHLHVHSEYSLTDSTIRVGDLVDACVRAAMPAVALTDQSNLFALVKFYKAAEAAGIKPIAGCDLWVAARDERAAPQRLTLLCQNREGYLNLSRLLSRAYAEGRHGEHAIVGIDWLDEHNAGLIALAGRDSDIGRLMISGRDDYARARAERLRAQFPDRFYLEATRTHRPNEDVFLDGALALAEQLDLPIVASNDVRFLTRDDFEAHEARVCIHAGRVLADPKRPRDYSPDQYLKSPDEMAALFADLPELIDNSVELAKRCNLELSFGKYFLPAFPVPAAHTLDSFIRDSARTGLVDRLAKHAPAAGFVRDDYEKRLETELDVIVQMGFPGYFLIVADFINWAKQHDIPVGPGRGSGAGSLVAYALGITDLDPLRYDLLFERFLNPERVSLPDFDVDFCMDRRDEVIDYVAEKYGRDRVSQIITYGTMAAKAVLRDTGRVLGMPYGQVDRIAKLLPKVPLDLSLEDALGRSDKSRKEPDRVVAEFKAMYASDEEVKELVDLALKLEDLTRNAGKHAGGVVIAPGPLTDFAPLFSEGGGEGLVTQFDKDDVEAVGLVKFDFLGLRTLTIIDWAVKAINVRRAQRGETPIDIATLPLDDAATYALLKRCQTTAIFQLESRGMQRSAQEAAAGYVRGHHRAGRAVPPGPAAVRHGRRLHRAQARPRRSRAIRTRCSSRS